MLSSNILFSSLLYFQQKAEVRGSSWLSSGEMPIHEDFVRVLLAKGKSVRKSSLCTFLAFLNG
jgi:hypothetical protein